MIKDERGSTLLLVTWIFLVMGVLAAFLFYRAESEWAFVVNLEKSTACRQMAEGALQERLTLLANDKTEFDTKKDDWFANGRIEAERDGYQITVLIEDEGCKPNINLLGGESIKNIIGDELSEDPVIDWRDLDDDTRGNGAESDYYQSLTPPYKARNGFLASVEELNEIKNAAKLYPVLAPEVTVYGKINPNTMITRDTFVAILLTQGFEKSWSERVADEYTSAMKSAAQTRATLFQTYDDFLKLKSVTIESRDKFKKVFHFKGNCNINFITTIGLAALLKQAGNYDDRNLPRNIVNSIKERPLEQNDDIATLLKNVTLPRKSDLWTNYFTTVSRIIRYKIWVSKGTRKYYLETVQERVESDQKGKWLVHPLSWRTLINDDVPAIPETSEDPDNEEH